MKEFNRRDFICFSGSAAVVLCLPFLSCETPKVTSGLKMPSALLKTFNVETIEEFGNSYLKTTPKENNADILVKLIVDDKLHLIKESSIRDYIANKITLDFREDRIILINGCIISITEARQCALSTLNF